MRSTNKVLTATALLVAVGGFWPAMASADPDTGPAPGPSPATPAATSAATSISADGTYTVGSQLAPGAYSTAGPVGDGVCSFKIVSGDNIKDSAFTKKPQVVQIAADDTTFKTTGCQPWQPADCSEGCGPPGGSPQQVLGQLGSFLLPRLGTPAPTG